MSANDAALTRLAHSTAEAVSSVLEMFCPGQVTTGAPVVVEDGVALGIGAIVLKGVTIGAGARVAAGTVVTADVPTGAEVAGNPGRVLEKL